MGPVRLMSFRKSLLEMVMTLLTSATIGQKYTAMEAVVMIHSTFQLILIECLCLEAKVTMS